MRQDGRVAIDFSISSITFSDGTRVTTPRKGVTVIVGPNNSGKTASLKDLIANLGDEMAKKQSRVLKDVTFDTAGDIDDFRQWMGRYSHEEPSGREITYRRMGRQVRPAQSDAAWQNLGSGYIGPLADFLTMYADVDQRAHLFGAHGIMGDIWDMTPNVPVHYLYLDGDLEEEFSRICEATFGQPLTLQRLGAQFLVRVGIPIADVPPLNRPTKEYAEAEKALPPLQEQGHGMRSYMGLALLLLVQSYHVVLIDEPEAFLHPPQRRELGRLMGDLASRRESQLFVSTHDTEFLWGLLDGPSEVTVVRLTRDGKINHAKEIGAEEAKTLWTDPLLRYSRVFDGLFYDRVVVAESDADCRFFAAVLDYLVEVESFGRPDVLFVPAGGKDRMHVAVSALRRVGVNAVAAADFDMLRDEQSLRRLVLSVGGDWDRVAALRRRFADAISSKKMTKPISGLRAHLDSLIPSDAVNLDRATSKAVTELFAFRDGWDEAKRAGLSSVPSGDAYQSCSLLLDELSKVGLYISPVGELESFVRGEGGHGPKWVSAVLSKGSHKQAGEAHDFVRMLVRG